MRPAAGVGFWRERVRGVGAIVLLGVAILAVATVLAGLALLLPGPTP